MKLIVKRGFVTPEHYAAVEKYECELVHMDEEFAVVNGLTSVGFVDEATMSYYDPSDPESVAIINAAAELRPANLTVQEIIDNVKAQESPSLNPPADVINDDLLAGFKIGEDGLPELDKNGEPIPLSDQNEEPESPESLKIDL